MESPLGSDLARLVRVWRALIDHRLKPLELTQTHWVTLHNIHQLPPEQSQIQLAKAIGIEQPSLVRTLDQLEEKGLISRQTCASDRRAKRIKLTEKAEPLINEMEEVIGKTRDEILSGVSKQEVETLLHLIRKLEQNILDLGLKINSLRPGLIRAFFTLLPMPDDHLITSVILCFIHGFVRALNARFRCHAIVVGGIHPMLMVIRSGKWLSPALTAGRIRSAIACASFHRC